VLKGGQHVHEPIRKSILCLFVKHHLLGCWLFGSGRLLVGFGGAGVCRRSGGGAGVIVGLVACFVVV